MKKTIAFENKIVMVIDHDLYLKKKKFNTFEEAYEAMNHYYTDESGDVLWDEEEWNEEFDFEETKGKFEAYGYVEFCDRDEITTTELLLNQAINEIK